MEQFLSFRNFRQFERSRKEIRLPYGLLNDLRFRQLPDARKAHLICLLLLSARMAGRSGFCVKPLLPITAVAPRCRYLVASWNACADWASASAGAGK